MGATYRVTLWNDNGPIEIDRRCRMGRKLAEPFVIPFQREYIIKKWKNTTIDIIVIANNARAAIDCIDHIERNTTRDIPWKLVVVDNASDKFTSDELTLKMDLERDRLLKMFDYCGYLPALQVACENTSGDWIVYVDQHVLVTDGWLERMLDAARENVGIVVPISNYVLSMLPGTNHEGMAEIVKEESSRLHTEIAFPRNFCTLFKRDLYDKIGGFDVQYYAPGYGEFYEFYLKMIEYGFKAVVADDCFVLDESAERYSNVSWQPENRAGYLRFMKRWKEVAFEVYGRYRNWEYVEDIVQRIDKRREVTTGNLKRQKAKVCCKVNQRPKVLFVFRELSLCGAVLAVVHICNKLNEIGYDANIACTRIELNHRKYIPMKFEPIVCGSEVELENIIRKRYTGSFIVATIWVTCENVQRICDNRTDLRPVYFVQDDERRFRHKSGDYYARAEDIEQTYSMFENVIVNSQWVQKMLLDEFNVESKFIGIGVDPLVFYPREKGRERVRIMAHCRKSTPRRGWEFISKVLNRVALSRMIEVVTYDEQPDDLQVTWQGHIGQVSPQELARHMGKADIFIEGSEIQGWGMQALESMACGCALVSTENLGINNYGTNGYDCLIVPQNNVEMAAGAVCHFIDNHAKRLITIQRARETAVAFRWEVIALHWTDYLEGII